MRKLFICLIEMLYITILEVLCYDVNESSKVRHLFILLLHDVSINTTHQRWRSTAQLGVALRSISQHCVALRSTAQHYVALRTTLQHYVTLRSTTQHWAVCCSTQHCILTWRSVAQQGLMFRSSQIQVLAVCITYVVEHSSALRKLSALPELLGSEYRKAWFVIPVSILGFTWAYPYNASFYSCIFFFSYVLTSNF